MKIEFHKYHGAGNDFIMIDARGSGEKVYSEELIKMWCDRHWGIGADGLILLLNDKNVDFRMKYFNSDGREGTMCGNGGRCVTLFARNLGIIKDRAKFSGIDGIHESIISSNENISLKMMDVTKIEVLHDGYLLDTGSSHFVIFRDDLLSTNVVIEGREIRNQVRFGIKGTNVNFVQMITDLELNIRTYERGVEDETLACGTGAVASAISAYLRHHTDKNSYLIHARGGELNVSFDPGTQSGFRNIWLTGPAKSVFSGKIRIKEYKI